mmetsp:Transcript_92955/g.240640  ORF Transcript_92955/g.240640 Transcript_92955/m.240640 type:complete len:138 (-) Transcript_92955:498-911(-)
MVQSLWSLVHRRGRDSHSTNAFWLETTQSANWPNQRCNHKGGMLCLAPLGWCTLAHDADNTTPSYRPTNQSPIAQFQHRNHMVGMWSHILHRREHNTRSFSYPTSPFSSGLGQLGNHMARKMRGRTHGPRAGNTIVS